MASAGANTDIAHYVKEGIQERIESRDLVVGDQSLILEIEQALTKHADRMYIDSTSSLYLFYTDEQGFFG